MSSRIRGRTSAWAAALALVPLLALVSACSSSGDDPPDPTPTPEVDTPMAAVVLNPSEKPDLVLPDTKGVPFDLRADTEGKLTLVYLGYTFCPDICPAEMAELTAGLKKVEPEVRDQIEVVFITVDPERDKPEVLARWLAAFDASYVGLVPVPGDVADIAKSFGMEVPQRAYIGDAGYYTMSHPAYVRAYLTDNMMRYIFPAGFSPEFWAHDLNLLVKDKEKFTP